MSQSLRRELRWVLQQACTEEEIHRILEILLDGLREASERYGTVILDRRKVLEAEWHEERALYERTQAPAPRSDARYLSVKDAAIFLGLSPRTLEQWRLRGGGPLFSKFGRGVRYDRADLEAWMTKHKKRSTSDP